MKLIKFSSPTCTPCKMMTPLVHRLQEEIGINVMEVDVTQSEELTYKYKVKSVPTFILLNDNSEELKRTVGSMTYDNLKKFVNEIN